jgi:undecaprenyl diphosphate synthase
MRKSNRLEAATPSQADSASPATGAGAVPQHVAIIMDGNGRWAKARGLPRFSGHKKGAEVLRSLLRGCVDIGIRYLTVYAFSSENWNRPAPEVTDLMGLLKYYLNNELEEIDKNNIKLIIIGDRSRLSADIRAQIEAAEARTRDNTALVLCIGLSYGARQEILRALQKMLAENDITQLTAQGLDETRFSAYLDTACLPDPDLLIRTGGEQRLSNFLLWQSAYAELYFTPTLWPDFSVDHLRKAVADYGQRERRYGTISA